MAVGIRAMCICKTLGLVGALGEVLNFMLGQFQDVGLGGPRCIGCDSPGFAMPTQSPKPYIAAKAATLNFG